ncbi:MAG: reverse transcriptase domain-containing protein [Candidatus Marithrix sp.]
MAKHYPQIPFVRYADDIVCHCKTQQKAEQLQNILIERFGQCQLRLNHQKTKIVYCQSWKHNNQYEKICFDFLGFTFRPRLIKTRLGKLMVCFLPAISQKASKQIRDTINSWAWTAWIHMEIADIIRFAYSKLTGWMTYYGKFGFGLTKHILFHFDQKLNCWVKRKYKSIKTKAQAVKKIILFKFRNPELLPHW